MAKEIYGIPARLNRSYGDHEIHLSSSLPGLSLKQIAYFALGFGLLFWLLRATFLSKAETWVLVMFSFWYLIALFYLGRMTKTKELTLMQVPVVMNYIPRKARNVITRSTSSPTPFYSVTSGLEGIDEDGTIHLYGGAKAVIYRVVGSASYLLFDEDRVEIIDRADAFWRKVDPACEWISITTKEPQRIHHQLANLEKRNRNLVNRDPDLIGLQNESYEILVNYVGSEFSSFHQYMMLRADSAEALIRARKDIEAEYSSSTLMFREAQIQDRTEVVPLLQTFFQGVSGGSVFARQGYGRTPAERAKAQLAKE